MTTSSEFGFTDDRVPLRGLIERHGPFSPEAALLVFRESLLGLAAAHDHGIVYREYSPDSMLVDYRGSSELVNFNATGGVGGGLAPYQAPEQRNGFPPSPASNVYAATAVFFECLTGLAPSPEQIRRFKRQQLAVPALTGEAAGPLGGLMAWGMAANPVSRPASAADLIVELDDMASAVYGPDWRGRARRDLAERVAATLASGRGAAANADGRPPALLRRSRGRVSYAGVAIAAAVLILGAGGTAVALTSHSGLKPSAAASSASSAGSGSTSGSGSRPAAGPAGASTVAHSAPSGGKATFTAGPGATPSVTSSACAAPASCGQPTPTTAASPSASAPPGATAPPTLASPPDITVQIGPDQPTPKTVVCGSTPPTYQMYAFITVNSGALPAETYHWVWPDGTSKAPGTRGIGTAGAVWVDYFTPSSDTWSGNATLVFTSPVKESWSIPLAMTCTPAIPLALKFPAGSSDGAMNVTLNEPFSATFTHVGGTGPYTWTAGSLPPGLTMNASTGTVSGTVTDTRYANGYSVITLRDSETPNSQISLHFTFNVVLP